MRIRCSILALITLVSGCSHEPTINEAYLKFYSAPDYAGLALSVGPPSVQSVFSIRGDVGDFSKVLPDNEPSGDFNDKATSVIYLLPKGWAIIVFEHGDYSGAQYKFTGTGKVEQLPDLQKTIPPFDHRISSLRWIRE